MPKKGYSTIGLKPDVFSLLQDMTDRYYPGMFLPSTLIILMHEVRQEYYTVEMHRVKVNLAGQYASLTIRSDVKKWLENCHAELAGDYRDRYGIKCFSHFVSYFLANLLESKMDSQKNMIKLKEADFVWLHEEYQRRRRGSSVVYGGMSFERFADLYINELLGKMRTAREILTV